MSKRKVKVEKEGKSFTKPKSTIIIEEKKNSIAGEVDKGGEKTLYSIFYDSIRKS